jgi:hypothetical protein
MRKHGYNSRYHQKRLELDAQSIAAQLDALFLYPPFTLPESLAYKRTSRGGTPHVVIYDYFSICWFHISKRYKVFHPFPTFGPQECVPLLSVESVCAYLLANAPVLLPKALPSQQIAARQIREASIGIPLRKDTPS